MNKKEIETKFSERFDCLIELRYGTKRGRYERFNDDFSKYLIQHDKDGFFQGIADNMENNRKQWSKGHVPKNPTLISLANFFHVSVDYLLGNADAPEDYGEEYVHDTLGLDYDAIHMIKLLLTNPKFAEKNRNCLDTLNLLLADHYRQIKDASGNNGYTHSNIFNDVWEYIHSNEAYCQSLTEDIGDSKQTHFYVGLDSESVKFAPVSDVVEYRAQKNIFKKLDELKEKISRH